MAVMEKQIRVSSMEDEENTIVKRLSVPVGLEELMTGFAKEVLRTNPKDIYNFASEHFAHLLALRDNGAYLKPPTNATYAEKGKLRNPSTTINGSKRIRYSISPTTSKEKIHSVTKNNHSNSETLSRHTRSLSNDTKSNTSNDDIKVVARKQSLIKRQIIGRSDGSESKRSRSQDIEKTIPTPDKTAHLTKSKSQSLTRSISQKEKLNASKQLHGATRTPEKYTDKPRKQNSLNTSVIPQKVTVDSNQIGKQTEGSSYDSSILHEELEKAQELAQLNNYNNNYNPYILRQEINNASKNVVKDTPDVQIMRDTDIDEHDKIQKCIGSDADDRISNLVQHDNHETIASSPKQEHEILDSTPLVSVESSNKNEEENLTEESFNVSHQDVAVLEDHRTVSKNVNYDCSEVNNASTTDVNPVLNIDHAHINADKDSPIEDSSAGEDITSSIGNPGSEASCEKQDGMKHTYQNRDSSSLQHSGEIYDSLISSKSNLLDSTSEDYKIMLQDVGVEDNLKRVISDGTKPFAPDKHTDHITIERNSKSLEHSGEFHDTLGPNATPTTNGSNSHSDTKFQFSNSILSEEHNLLNARGPLIENQDDLEDSAVDSDIYSSVSLKHSGEFHDSIITNSSATSNDIPSSTSEQNKIVDSKLPPQEVLKFKSKAENRGDDAERVSNDETLLSENSGYLQHSGELHDGVITNATIATNNELSTTTNEDCNMKTQPNEMQLDAIPDFTESSNTQKRTNEDDAIALTNRSGACGLQHTGELHDSVTACDSTTTTTAYANTPEDSEPKEPIPNKSGDIDQDVLSESTQISLQHSGELHDLAISNNVESNIVEGSNKRDNNKKTLTEMQHATVDIATDLSESSSINLQHSGELHDIALPSDSESLVENALKADNKSNDNINAPAKMQHVIVDVETDISSGLNQSGVLRDGIQATRSMTAIYLGSSTTQNNKGDAVVETKHELKISSQNGKRDSAEGTFNSLLQLSGEFPKESMENDHKIVNDVVASTKTNNTVLNEMQHATVKTSSETNDDAVDVQTGPPEPSGTNQWQHSESLVSSGTAKENTSDDSTPTCPSMETFEPIYEKKDGNRALSEVSNSNSLPHRGGVHNFVISNDTIIPSSGVTIVPIGNTKPSNEMQYEEVMQSDSLEIVSEKKRELDVPENAPVNSLGRLQHSGELHDSITVNDMELRSNIPSDNTKTETQTELPEKIEGPHTVCASMEESKHVQTNSDESTIKVDLHHHQELHSSGFTKHKVDFGNVEDNTKINEAKSETVKSEKKRDARGVSSESSGFSSLQYSGEQCDISIPNDPINETTLVHTPSMQNDNTKTKDDGIKFTVGTTIEDRNIDNTDEQRQIQNGLSENSASPRLQHSGELHDSLLIKEPTIQNNFVDTKKDADKVMHTLNNEEKEIMDKEHKLGIAIILEQSSPNTYSTESSSNHQHLESQNYANIITTTTSLTPENSIPEDGKSTRLKHTGELHDSTIPNKRKNSTKGVDSITNHLLQGNQQEVIDSLISHGQVTESGEELQLKPSDRLQHSGEFHDSLILNDSLSFDSASRIKQQADDSDRTLTEDEPELNLNRQSNKDGLEEDLNIQDQEEDGGQLSHHKSKQSSEYDSNQQRHEAQIIPGHIGADRDQPTTTGLNPYVSVNSEQRQADLVGDSPLDKDMARAATTIQAGVRGYLVRHQQSSETKTNVRRVNESSEVSAKLGLSETKDLSKIVPESKHPLVGFQKQAIMDVTDSDDVSFIERAKCSKNLQNQERDSLTDNVHDDENDKALNDNKDIYFTKVHLELPDASQSEGSEIIEKNKDVTLATLDTTGEVEKILPKGINHEISTSAVIKVIEDAGLMLENKSSNRGDNGTNIESSHGDMGNTGGTDNSSIKCSDHIKEAKPVSTLNTNKNENLKCLEDANIQHQTHLEHTGELHDTPFHIELDPLPDIVKTKTDKLRNVEETSEQNVVANEQNQTKLTSNVIFETTIPLTNESNLGEKTVSSDLINPYTDNPHSQELSEKQKNAQSAIESLKGNQAPLQGTTELLGQRVTRSSDDSLDKTEDALKDSKQTKGDSLLEPAYVHEECKNTHFGSSLESTLKINNPLHHNGELHGSIITSGTDSDVKNPNTEINGLDFDSESILPDNNLIPKKADSEIEETSTFDISKLRSEIEEATTDRSFDSDVKEDDNLQNDRIVSIVSGTKSILDNAIEKHRNEVASDALTYLPPDDSTVQSTSSSPESIHIVTKDQKDDDITLSNDMSFRQQDFQDTDSKDFTTPLTTSLNMHSHVISDDAKDPTFISRELMGPTDNNRFQETLSKLPEIVSKGKILGQVEEHHQNIPNGHVIGISSVSPINKEIQSTKPSNFDISKLRLEIKDAERYSTDREDSATLLLPGTAKISETVGPEEADILNTYAVDNSIESKISHETELMQSNFLSGAIEKNKILETREPQKCSDGNLIERRNAQNFDLSKLQLEIKEAELYANGSEQGLTKNIEDSDASINERLPANIDSSKIILKEIHSNSNSDENAGTFSKEYLDKHIQQQCTDSDHKQKSECPTNTTVHNSFPVVSVDGSQSTDTMKSGHGHPEAIVDKERPLSKTPTTSADSVATVLLNEDYDNNCIARENNADSIHQANNIKDENQSNFNLSMLRAELEEAYKITDNSGGKFTIQAKEEEIGPHTKDARSGALIVGDITPTKMNECTNPDNNQEGFIRYGAQNEIPGSHEIDSTKNMESFHKSEPLNDDKAEPKGPVEILEKNKITKTLDNKVLDSREMLSASSSDKDVVYSELSAKSDAENINSCTSTVENSLVDNKKYAGLEQCPIHSSNIKELPEVIEDNAELAIDLHHELPRRTDSMEKNKTLEDYDGVSSNATLSPRFKEHEGTVPKALGFVLDQQLAITSPKAVVNPINDDSKGGPEYIYIPLKLEKSASETLQEKDPQIEKDKQNNEPLNTNVPKKLKRYKSLQNLTDSVLVPERQTPVSDTSIVSDTNAIPKDIHKQKQQGDPEYICIPLRPEKDHETFTNGNHGTLHDVFTEYALTPTNGQDSSVNSKGLTPENSKEEKVTTLEHADPSSVSKDPKYFHIPLKNSVESSEGLMHSGEFHDAVPINIDIDFPDALLEDVISPRKRNKHEGPVTTVLGAVLDQQLAITAPLAKLKDDDGQDDATEYIYIPLKDPNRVEDDIEPEGRSNNQITVSHNNHLKESPIQIEKEIASNVNDGMDINNVKPCLLSCDLTPNVDPKPNLVPKEIDTVPLESAMFGSPLPSTQYQSLISPTVKENTRFLSPIPEAKGMVDQRDSSVQADSPPLLIQTSQISNNGLPLAVQINQAPGAESLTSQTPNDAQPSIISDGTDKKAHVPGKAASTSVEVLENSTHLQNSMETDKRKSASIVDRNMETVAATKIQASFRGYQVRKQLKSKNGGIDSIRRSLRRKSSGKLRGSENYPSKNVENKCSSTDLEEKSATTIQAGIRGFLVRRRQKNNKKSSSNTF